MVTWIMAQREVSDVIMMMSKLDSDKVISCVELITDDYEVDRCVPYILHPRV